MKEYAKKCAALGGGIYRLSRFDRTGEFVPPGVYLAVLPEEGEHDDAEDVVGILAMQPVRADDLIAVMRGAAEDDAVGCYFRPFDSFADMALTLGQGLRAV